jgi:hypothetical protein
MKKLIVTTNTEIKDLTGFIDADFDYDNIKPSIIDASKEMIKLVGKEIYNKAYELYNIASPTDEQEEFVALMQRSIILNAYLMYAKTNDLSHSNNGRRMRNDDREKVAFEWQLDRDDDNQEKNFYRSLDYLIDFLESLEIYTGTDTDLLAMSEIATIWINSEAKKKEKAIFLNSVDQFAIYYPIESRFVFLKLKGIIKQCEDLEILPRLGNDKFNALKQHVLNNTTPTETKDRNLLDEIAHACAAYALSRALMQFSINLFPQGVLQYSKSDRASTTGKNPALGTEAKAAANYYREDFERYCLRIENNVKPTPEPTDKVVQPKIIYGAKFVSS